MCRMVKWLSKLSPVELDLPKSYVDFIDKEAHEMFEDFEQFMNEDDSEEVTQWIMYIETTTRSDWEARDDEELYRYSLGIFDLWGYRCIGVNLATYASDVIDKFILLTKCELEHTNVRERYDRKRWKDACKFLLNIHVYIERVERIPVPNLYYFYSIKPFHLLVKYSESQFVERVAYKVRVHLEKALPDIVKDLGGKPARLKVGKSFICGLKSRTFNQYKNETWAKSKGIGGRWHGLYKFLGYKRMMVVVALTEDDLPDCLHEYHYYLMFESSYSAESVALAIEDSLGRPGGDGKLIGCRLDNDPSSKHEGSRVKGEKDAFVVYVVYRPENGQRASILDGKFSAPTTQITSMYNVRYSLSCPPPDAVDLDWPATTALYNGYGQSTSGWPSAVTVDWETPATTALYNAYGQSTSGWPSAVTVDWERPATTALYNGYGQSTSGWPPAVQAYNHGVLQQSQWT